MQEKFQEKLMEIQEGLLSLCLEATKGTADKIFAYASIEEKSKSFNVFYEKNGEILTTNKLMDLGVAGKLLKLGTDELGKIVALSEEYSVPHPTEIKMWYDVRSGKFDVNYKYEEICSAKTGVGSYTVFMEWLEEEKVKANPSV